MFDMQQIIPLFILIPLVGVFIIALVARRNSFNADLIFFFSVFGLLIMSGYLLAFLVDNPVIVYCLGGWQLPEAITFVIDGLSGFMLGSVYLITFALMLYSLRFMDSYQNKWKFYSLFLLLLIGVNGVIISGDLFTMYLFMEVAAVSSYALVCFSLKANALAAGFKYMIKSVMASAVIFLAIAICYCYTSTLALSDIAVQLHARGNVAHDPGMSFVIVFIEVLFFCGLAMKSGIIPLSSWLAEAHNDSPALVSAILCSIVIPVLGIYPFIRIYFNVIGTTEMSLAIIRGFAILAMLGGLLWALKKHKLKHVIAYHTISEFGFVLLGIGIGSPLGILGALLHLLNTQVGAGLVSCNAGVLEYLFGQDRADKAKYSFKTMPLACMTSMIGSLAFIGSPPFLGFWSKLIIIFAAFQAGYKVFAFCGILAVVIAAVSFVKKQKSMFKKNVPNEVVANMKKISLSMSLALLIMSMLTFGLNVLLLQGGKNTFMKPAMKTIISGTDYSKTVLEASNEK